MTRMTLGELARALDAELVGDPAVEITNVAGIREAGAGDLTFLANDRYAPYVRETLASAILVRARPDAEALGDRLKAVLLNLEKDLVIVDVSTMTQVRWRLVAAERFRTTVLAVFALTAAFLALVKLSPEFAERMLGNLAERLRLLTARLK